MLEWKGDGMCEMANGEDGNDAVYGGELNVFRSLIPMQLQ